MNEWVGVCVPGKSLICLSPPEQRGRCVNVFSPPFPGITRTTLIICLSSFQLQDSSSAWPWATTTRWTRERAKTWCSSVDSVTSTRRQSSATTGPGAPPAETVTTTLPLAMIRSVPITGNAQPPVELWISGPGY